MTALSWKDRPGAQNSAQAIAQRATRTLSQQVRDAQVFLLVLAVFLLVNKVWSPQYVIWLTPLVVLARPRLPAYLLWQAAEVGYFLAIWSYLVTLLAVTPLPADGGIGNGLPGNQSPF